MSMGSLYVVATPIGNLGDMSARAIETLKNVDVILAEDTRHSAPLLRHFQIQTQCQAFHEHNEKEKAEVICQRVLDGQNVAIISDAGVPLISDPGFSLVRLAHEHGIPIVPIPGACAAITAISASGLPTDRFNFEGFLPAKRGPKERALLALANEQRTLIFYESPRRVVETLEIMRKIFGGERQVVIARELTKLFETIKKLPINDMLDFVSHDPNQVKGEIVLLVEGKPKQDDDEQDEALKKLLTILLDDVPLKQAVALAMKITDAKRNKVYPLALAIKQN